MGGGFGCLVFFTFFTYQTMIYDERSPPKAPCGLLWFFFGTKGELCCCCLHFLHFVYV
ncbi:hypothetical protein B0T21DRAFT_154205 [Apiosordaria backusii]|uniref:Uncharacterized protein n=1 Tax=Apiosordaria backusii TaxID=314023 RepID=A0AA40BML6_9PEZI|nr:hypothetical protein B0T21DRAFT_154205 [Apiosordaria backusii]